MPSYEEVRYHFNHHDPFARHMGIELLEVGPEHGVAIMPLDERHRNGMGHAHGGAIFALVDMTFATVSNAAGLYCVNAQTNISYLEPGRIGPGSRLLTVAFGGGLTWGGAVLELA